MLNKTLKIKQNNETNENQLKFQKTNENQQENLKLQIFTEIDENQ